MDFLGNYSTQLDGRTATPGYFSFYPSELLVSGPRYWRKSWNSSMVLSSRWT